MVLDVVQIKQKVQRNMLSAETTPEDVSILLFSMEDLKEILNDPSMGDLVQEAVDLDAPSLYLHPAGRRRSRELIMRLITECAVAACHDGYTHSTMEWFLKLVPKEIEDLTRCSDLNDDIVRVLEHIDAVYPLFTWITAQSWLSNFAEGKFGGSEYDSHMVKTRMRKNRTNDFMQNDWFVRNIGNSDKIQDFTNSVEWNARVKQWEDLVEKIEALLRSYGGGELPEIESLDTDEIKELCDSLDEILHTVDKKSGDGSPYKPPPDGAIVDGAVSAFKTLLEKIESSEGSPPRTVLDHTGIVHIQRGQLWKERSRTWPLAR